MRIQFLRAVWVVVLLAFAGALAGSAQPHLVTDLNQQRVDARRQPLAGEGVEHEGVLYFPAHDPQHGYELWRSDGSPAGTYRLVDLCPGICSGVENRPLGSFHGSLYFLGNDTEHGSEIWRTDGTVGGEELLADLCPGECWGSPYSWVEWRGAVWFLVQKTFDAPPALWTSDGTREGTRPVANLCADLSICISEPNQTFVDLAGPDPSGQGLLVWTVGHGPESLFRTDGTAGGTVLLHRFVEGFQYIDPIQRTGTGVPLFFIDNAELWTSDGTPAGTRLVRSLVGLVENFDLESFEVVDGIYHATFFATQEWLRSDGTAEGTFVLARVDPDVDSTVAHLGTRVVVVTSDGIWRTGGSPETTVRFDGPHGPILDVVEQPDRLFVLGFDQEHFRAFVWTTDGTPDGTRKIHLRGGLSPDEYGMTAFEGGVLLSRGLHELWRIDRTATHVERLHDFQPANGGSGPIEQVVLNHRLLFFSQIDAHRSRLFSSDGTAAGTSKISAAGGGGFGFDYHPVFTLTRAGDKAFFNDRGRLWTTDGTAEGTRSFRPQSSFYESFGMNAPIGVLGGQFLYSATLNVNDGPHCSNADSEPWTTDGVHGTKRLLNLNPFFEEPTGICNAFDYSSSPGPGVVLGGIALFAADDFVHGRELFATDGTADGTRRVADIDRDRIPYDNQYLEPHPLSFVGIGSDPTDLVRAGTNVFFVANDGRTGRELWISNGNRRGTRRVADLVPGPGGSTPRNLVAVGSEIYFFAANPPGSAGAAGDGLYRSDGTLGGTVLISDLAGVSQARDLTALKTGRLYFAAFRPETGTELWTSEGTAETTHVVADLRPGLRGSSPQNLKAVADQLVFAADDGSTGLEPWTSDGTPEGTVRWGDLSPGRDASTPGPFSVANGQLLFGADDGEHGRELWAMPVAELPK